MGSKPSPTTSSRRQQRYTRRLAQDGLVSCQLFVPEEWKGPLRALAAAARLEEKRGIAGAALAAAAAQVAGRAPPEGFGEVPPDRSPRPGGRGRGQPAPVPAPGRAGPATGAQIRLATRLLDGGPIPDELLADKNRMRDWISERTARRD